MTSPLSPQEALIYAMMTVAAVDRQVSEQELQRIGGIIKELPAFGGFGSDWLSREAQDCGRILSKPGGVDRVLEMIAAALAPELSETAYVLAAEVAASDLAIKAEETQFLELLADELGLDELICAALERGARARHQTLEVQRPRTR
jgi:tellurite resistance protein